MPDTQDPGAYYKDRLTVAEARRARLDRTLHVLVWTRLLWIIGCISIGYEACGKSSINTAWLWAALALLVGLSVVIEVLAQRIGHLAGLCTYYEAGRARVEERWQATAEIGLPWAHVSEDHPFAPDLDLFDKGGLFGLMSVARTALGKETLASWLRVPATAKEAVERQSSVRELAPLTGLREEIWQAAGRVKSAVRETAGEVHLEAWLRDPGPPAPKFARLMAALLAVAALPALWELLSGRWWLALLVATAQALLAQKTSVVREPIAAHAGRRAEELRVVGALIARLEQQTFQSPALAALRQTLIADGLSTKRRLQRLVRLVELMEARRNLAFAVVSAPFMMGTQVALAIDAWRRKHGPVAATWVRAVGTIEALASLATFAFDHPDFVYPTVLPESQGPVLSGRDVAHPLLPAATRVANDVALGGGGPQLILITGSNMSGKSTMLRTVGINVVLALAGAPVCARAFTLSPLRIGATLRVQDSLQAGTSRFLAEIKRLRTVVSMAETSPMTLFLLDELLHGTNSSDRHTGGEAILKALVDMGAIGLATTHDLSLTTLADSLAPRAVNTHFQDRVEDGKLVFDYKMQSGIVSRSNALDLMRLVGLKV